MSGPLPNHRLCGCGEILPSEAAWKRHIDGGCQESGRPRRVCELAAAERVDNSVDKGEK